MWQSTFDGKSGRDLVQPTFMLTLYPQVGLRYREGEKTITLLSEILPESEQKGWFSWILPSVMIVVYLPSVLHWDGGALLLEPEATVVRENIKSALKAAGEHPRLEVSDEIYSKVSRDWQRIHDGA